MHDARDRNAGIWIEHSDRLYVAAYSSVASLVVTFSGYFRKMDGTIIEWAQTVEPTSDRAVTAKTVFFGAGFLLSCVATLTTGNANRGQCYVRAQVQRGVSGSAVKLQNVVGGYVTDDYSPSFPYGKIEGPLEGAGVQRMVISAVPAAGDDFGEAVPTGAVWRPQSITAKLTTSVAAANREVTLYFYTGAVVAGAIVTGTNHTASLGITYNWLRGVQKIVYTQSLQYTLPLSEVMLSAGWSIISSTANREAADAWTEINIHVEEWIQA